MVVVKRLSVVPVRFGGEVHSGWLPTNAATPPPTPVEVAVVDFEISAAEGGYMFELISRNTGHCGDTWHETLDEALEQAKLSFGIEPEEWRPA